MADAQGDRIVHHLDLKPLFGSGLRIRFRIGVARQPETESANPDEEAPN